MESTYSAIFNAVSDAIFISDSENAKILDVNNKACEMFCYPKEEMLKLTIYDLCTRGEPFTTENAKKVMDSASEDKPQLFEWTCKDKAGRLFWVEVNLRRAVVGGKYRLLSVVRDITERKNQEKAILKRDYQLEILSRTSQHINAVLETPVIMRTLVTAAMELVDASGGTAGLLERGKLRFIEYVKDGKVEPVNYIFDKGPTLPGWVMETLKPYIANDAGRDNRVSPEFIKVFGLRNLINLPILNRNGELLGCFEIYNKTGGVPFDTEDVFVLQGLAASASVALENAKMLIERKRVEERLKKLALKDTLTGLYNHQYLKEIIEPEFYRARRYAHALSVIMLDIDYFKSVNDLYGHDFGDIVLKQFAEYLRKTVRKYDTVIRFGGEEFIIISPSVEMPRAQMMAQRILDAAGLYNFGNKEHLVKLKLSVAVSSYPDGKIGRGMDLVNAADRILAKVKEAGGNKVFSEYEISGKKSVIPKGVELTDVRFLKEKIEKLNRSGKQSLMEFISAFAKTIELKDHYTGEHVENTVHYSTELAKKLHLAQEDIDNIREASVLHDLGKIGVSDKILLKKSKLTKKETEMIKRHPQIAADIIRPIQFMHDIIPLILYHHERWDGKGYPAGLKGEEIPVGARIIAVADVYQALTSNRPYRKAFPKKDAVKMIKKGAGTQFDPNIADIFLRMITKEKE